MQNKWERRERKQQAKRRFHADNRVGIRRIQNIWKTRADEIKSRGKQLKPAIDNTDRVYDIIRG